MRNKKGTITAAEAGVLSIPQVMLDAAGIPSDCDLTVEAIPGVLIIARTEPLTKANLPFIKLFADMGIELEEVMSILEKGGYFCE